MSPTAPIFAFGLLNLPMLGWLAAAAVPIVIHLWSRRRYREMHWAAMQYLVAALRKRRRRLLLEQWLLLAVRTLIIVLLVLAVAQPYLERSVFSWSAGGRTHRVLVIDGSYSMAYKPTDKSRFDRAKEVAAQIVEQSPQGDGFTLVLMASPPQVAVGTPAFEPAELLREIGNLRISHTTADLPATLAMVQRIVEAVRQENPRLTRHEVFFLTDLGRVGWAPDPNRAAAAESRRRAEQLAESATLVVIDLGQPAAENLAIIGLRALESVVTPAQTAHFDAQVKNFGRGQHAHQPVELLVDGRRVQQQYVDLPPGGEATVAFSYRFETSGDHALEVRLEGDRLELDNHRWMAVPVRPFVRVLCIDGRPSGEPFRGAADYLLLALAPQDSETDPTLVRPEVAPESALLERDLGQYDCIFLCNVAQFTPSEAKVLDAYTNSGGNLVFFLGDRVLADRYNRQLAAEGAGSLHLLPAQVGPVVADPQSHLDPLGYRHPMVQAFRGRERAGLLSTPVSKYFRLIVPKNSKTTVVLAFANGDPMIVEEPVRRGHVVLVATSADISWTAMPLWPSFVPLVQEMLAYCVGGQLKQQNRNVGQVLEGSVPAPSGDVPLVMHRPDGASQPLRLRPEGDYSTWSYAEATASGIYTARFGEPPGSNRLFAVNLDTTESDLKSLGLDELRNTVWPGVALHYQTTWQNSDRQPMGRIASRGALPVGLLYLVLILLFLETSLAWRQGHHAP